VSRPEVVKLLRDGKRFLLFLHELPDGDSVGSTLGLRLALLRLGKEVTVAGPDHVPRVYRFLPGAEHVVLTTELVPADWDVTVLLDCAEPARVKDAWAMACAHSHTVINIDHHATNTMFGDVNLVDPKAAATAEQVYDVLGDLGVTVDREIGLCLLAGLVTDTGSFRYENTTPRALRVAAALLEAGAEPWELATRLYESRALSGLRLLARALQTLTLTEDGRIAWLVVDDSMLAETGAEEEETEGLVNYPRSLEGVEIAVVFRVLGTGETRVALRSRGRADVSRMARALGGGGHPRAAGCLIPGGREEAVARVLAEARREVPDRLGRQ